MKNILILAALLCAVNLHAISTDSTIPVYGTGGFRDPVYTIDRSQRWLGSDLSTTLTVAESFSLQYNSVLSKVELWSYDTVDGSGGTLKELRYAIYTGATQPTGAPVASGLGKILSSDGIGHVSPTDGTLASIDGKLFVIQTIFNLASAVHLFPNVTYWLAIAARTDPFGSSASAQWAESGNDPAHAGSYLVLTDTGWTEVDKGDRAFELDGQGRRLVTLSKDKVPDGGATLCLLVLAMIPLLRLRAGRNPGV